MIHPEAFLAAGHSFAADVEAFRGGRVVALVVESGADVATLGAAVLPLADVANSLALGGPDTGEIERSDELEFHEVACLGGLAVDVVDLVWEGRRGVRGPERIGVSLEIHGVEEARKGADSFDLGTDEVGIGCDLVDLQQDGGDGSVDVGNADFGARERALAGVLKAVSFDWPGVVSCATPDDVA